MLWHSKRRCCPCFYWALPPRKFGVDVCSFVEVAGGVEVGLSLPSENGRMELHGWRLEKRERESRERAVAVAVATAVAGSGEGAAVATIAAEVAEAEAEAEARPGAGTGAGLKPISPHGLQRE